MTTKTWPQIATENGLERSTYRYRRRKGWSQERAATEPQRFDVRGPWVEHNGERVLALSLAKRCGLEPRIFKRRVRAGWPIVLAATTESPYRSKIDGRCCLDLVDTATGPRPAYQVAHENGVRWVIARQRVKLHGWTLARAVTEPPVDGAERCRRARAAVSAESRKRGAHVTAMQRVAGKIGTLYAFSLPETNRIKVGFTVQDVESYRRHRQLHAMQRIESLGSAPGTGDDEARYHSIMERWRVPWLGNETYEATPEAIHAAVGFLESLRSAVRAPP